MTFEAAPLFTDVHPAPLPGSAYWLRAEDGVRIRVGCWRPDGAKGTVLMFPGRTEYVEKYAPSAGALAERGFATIAVDWRGQGLADRLHEERRLGHVNEFSDYQRDVAAVVDAARTLRLPEPYFLLGHSMGGCIGLRALYEGLPVNAAGFTGPMWGIRISPHLRPVAWALGHMMPVIGQGHRLPPGTIIDSYVLTSDFDDNLLTTDIEMFDMMRDQLTAHPELALGGPSFVWLREALQETLALSRMPAPNLPCDTFVGTNERIVHVGRIHQRMDGWDDGHLHQIQNGEHEVLMEDARTRAGIFDTLAHRFADAA
ncbi:alpha/beta hydrolase [Tateyamaria omphalii]|uniref:alpha/beta fold hydrolase n=1 Tax=Tateyamaria omphalii TaxID=299262 RepID=UPI001C990C75|nr:alpha/beta hydrolase [Tateyamaria omphalii]MBY5932066.1 alpha/beta hydrolase [Tateyamaria omphalii]